MQSRTRERIRNYIRENLSRGYSLKSIEKGLVAHGYESKFSREMVSEFDVRTHLNKNLLFMFAFLALVFGLFFVKPTFMGYITFAEQDNFTDILNLEVNESSSYVWELGNKGDLKRVGINAKFSGGGYAKVYLRHNDVDYVVFDSSRLEEGLAGVTGFVVLNESNETNEIVENQTLVNETLEEQITVNETSVNESVENRSIELVLSYYNDSSYDNDVVVDLSVAESEFNVDEDKLCIRWSVDSGESVNHVCYGNDRCCDFLDLESSSSSWNDTYYSYLGKEGAGYDNIISAQVVYVDYNLSEIEAEIVYSEVLSLPVRFKTPYTEFEDVCVETCLLPGLNALNYTLIFEVVNSSLEIDSISYTVENERVVNNAPKLVKNISDISIVKNYTINLSKHFLDEDGDVLEFSYYKAEGVSVIIDKDIAVVSASEFVGSRSMFFIANDSSLIAVSNVFRVSVGEAIEEEVKKINRTRVVIGKPVRWVKRVKLDNGVAKVNVTKGAFNVSVKDVVNDIEVDKSKIKVVEDKIVKSLEDYETEKEDKRKPKKSNMITGAVIGLASSEEENVTELIIEDLVEEIEVEYYTEGPTAEEFVVNDYKKRITISSDIHYEDILSYTYLPVEVNENAVKLYWLVNDSRQEVSIDKFDTNNNSLIDYIEWIVPSLSNQTYEIIIEISEAEHLDENRTFISDIYEQVKEKDGIWSEIIENNEYVRVTFEVPLDSSRDITLYPRTVSGTPRIEVYEIDGIELIAEFTNIVSNEYNKVFLGNLQGTQDTFDLRILDGSLEFDHIIDPIESPNQPSLNYPPNESIGIELSPVLNITVTDPDGDSMNVTFWNEIQSIAVGNSYSCGLLSNGSAMCWGWNHYGQIGDGSTTQRNSPVSVNTTESFISIDAGETSHHTCGVLSNGSVMCWGDNGYGQLGNGSTSTYELNPIFVNSTESFVSITAGGSHTCGLLSNGSAMCWGYNWQGQVGDGTSGEGNDRYSPVFVNSTESFVSIDAGYTHTCGLLSNGSMMCWGANTDGQVGDGTSGTNRVNPVSVNSTESFVSIDAGRAHTCGILSNGRAMCWGQNTEGQAGIGSSGADELSPVLVNTVESFVSITGGGFHTCGVLNNGSAMCWGRNNYGQLGNGSNGANILSPVSVNSTESFVSIDAGTNYCCGILSNGSAMCWGRNNYGQIGVGVGGGASGPDNCGENACSKNPIFVNTTNSMESPVIGNATDVASGSVATTIWADLYQGRTYLWRTTVSDGDSIANSPIWKFTTGDFTAPIINFSGGTENNNTYFNRDWVYVNISITETNQNETRFYLYNTSGLVNNTNYTDSTTYINFTNLNSNMVYYYNVTHIDKANNSNFTETRKITLDSSYPSIDFVSPISANATVQSDTFVEINISITETNLDEVKFNWNGTNFTMYNDSLVLMYNFDNVSVLGENSTYVVDNSNYGNNGTVTSATMNLTGGKYGGAFEFDGISDYITVDSMNGNINGTITISTWINWKGDSADTDPTGRLTLINLLSPEDDVWLNLNADGNSKFNVYFGDLASPGYHDSTSSITKDEWHYLVANWNGSHVNLYIDGILDKSVSTTGDVDVGSSSFKIGSRENFADGWNFFFNGSIDEVRIWNRSLSTDEIYQQYASNLNKFNSTQWYLYVNQSKNATTGLADGDYTYYASAKDSAGNENSTEERKVTIDSTYPSIEFTGGTESNNTYFNRDWVFANVSITELNMRNISWNWNGTEYVLYDESSILLFNFDNVSALGDNASYATDISKYNNSGIISGAAWNTSGRFHSALSFDGVNDFVNITNDTIFSVMPFSMGFWFNPVQDYNLSSNPASFVSHNDYDIFIGDGNLTFRFLGYNLSSSKTSWNKNEWYNVQMVRNKEKQSIYINGSLNASTVFSNLEIQNSNGDTTALFDNYGNIILRGSCVIGGCDYPLDDAFVVQNDSDTVAYVNSSGHLCIEDDNCNENDGDCSGPGDGALVITNDIEIVSYINSSGKLCLKGEIMENVNP